MKKKKEREKQNKQGIWGISFYLDLIEFLSLAVKDNESKTKHSDLGP